MVDVSFNNNTRKFNFKTITPGSADPNSIKFDLDFTYNKSLKTTEANSYSTNFKTINDQHLSLGWMMGFRKTNYTYDNDYHNTTDSVFGRYKAGLQGESQYDQAGSRYYPVSYTHLTLPTTPYV